MPSFSLSPVSPRSNKKRRYDDAEMSVEVQMKLSRHAEPSLESESKLTFPSPRHASMPDHGNAKRTLSLKRQRIHKSEVEKQKEVKRRESETQKIDLSRCHICHRKPTEKKQLQDYADCQDCGGRMCFICMRECNGQGGQVDVDVDVDVEGDYNVLSCSFDGNVEGMVRLEKGSEGKREHGHKRYICSGCCAEVGKEGEVVCFGCLGGKGADGAWLG